MGTDIPPVAERACEWCRIPYHFWQAIRCIETADDFVFCSAICLERYEDATGREQGDRSSRGYASAGPDLHAGLVEHV